MIRVLGEGTDEQEIRFNPGVVLGVEIHTYAVEVHVVPSTNDLTEDLIQSLVVPRIAIRKMKRIAGDGLRIHLHTDTVADGLPGYVPIALAARG